MSSYATALELCHQVILGIDTKRNLHRFHALLAQRWMLGWSVPRIIAARIKRMKRRREAVDLRKVIRETLEIIEQVVRFQMIRLFWVLQCRPWICAVGEWSNRLFEPNS